MLAWQAMSHVTPLSRHVSFGITEFVTILRQEHILVSVQNPSYPEQYVIISKH